MKTFTLQQIYFAAKVIIEKYNAVDNDRSLRVSVDIEDREGVPTLKIFISYYTERYETGFGASGATPNNALNEFESNFQERTGKKLIERIAVEVEECSGNCGMNYCDENGCVDRKRNLVEADLAAPATS